MKTLVKAYIFALLSIVTLSPTSAETNTTSPGTTNKQVTNGYRDWDGYRDSVLLLKSSDQNGCATGFLLKATNGQTYLTTNQHVLEALCPLGDCDKKIKAFREDATSATGRSGLPLELGPTPIVFPALDVAFVPLLKDPPAKKLLSLRPTSYKFDAAEPLYSLGFPSCGTLSESIAHSLKNNSLHFYAPLKTSHGSSGSPVFSAKGELIGVVDQAGTLGSAIMSLLMGSEFSSTRVIRADVISQLLESSTDNAIAAQESLLLAYYRDAVRQTSGMDRLLLGSSFTYSVERLRSLAAKASPTTPESLLPYLILGDYPARPIRCEWLLFDNRALDLTLAYNLEVHGPSSSFLTPMDLDSFKGLLAPCAYDDRKNRPHELIELADFALNSEFSGLEQYTIKLGLVAVLALLLLAYLSGLLSMHMWSRFRARKSHVGTS